MCMWCAWACTYTHARVSQLAGPRPPLPAARPPPHRPPPQLAASTSPHLAVEHPGGLRHALLVVLLQGAVHLGQGDRYLDAPFRTPSKHDVKHDIDGSSCKHPKGRRPAPQYRSNHIPSDSMSQPRPRARLGVLLAVGAQSVPMGGSPRQSGAVWGSPGRRRAKRGRGGKAKAATPHSGAALAGARHATQCPHPTQQIWAPKHPHRRCPRLCIMYLTGVVSRYSSMWANACCAT